MRTKPRQWYSNRTFALAALPLLFGIFNPGAWLDGSSPIRNPQSAFRIRTVVIDPGHGGKDPGCGGQFSREKDNALAVSLALGSLIEASFPQVKVVFTRKTDVFIPLIDRARVANEAKADLFISIHCNSLPVRKQEIDGTEVYVLGLHVAERNLDVARRENESILLEKDGGKNYSMLDPDTPEGAIFLAAWQSAYMEQSIAFASLVNEGVAASGRNGRGVRQAGFMVLKETAAPSVLIETAYLTSETDEGYIASEEGQGEMAAVIFNAFSEWKTQMEGGPVASQKGAKPSASTQPKGGFVPKKEVAERREVASAGAAVFPKKAPAAAVSPAPSFKILLTASSKKLDLKKDPLATVGKVEEQKTGGEYWYFATGFVSRAEAKRALPELRGLGFPEARLVE